MIWRMTKIPRSIHLGKNILQCFTGGNRTKGELKFENQYYHQLKRKNQMKKQSHLPIYVVPFVCGPYNNKNRRFMGSIWFHFSLKNIETFSPLLIFLEFQYVIPYKIWNLTIPNIVLLPLGSGLATFQRYQTGLK